MTGLRIVSNDRSEMSELAELIEQEMAVRLEPQPAVEADEGDRGLDAVEAINLVLVIPGFLLTVADLARRAGVVARLESLLRAVRQRKLDARVELPNGRWRMLAEMSPEDFLSLDSGHGERGA
jgi:hypothetical protein